jgi:galactonate dehydratase
VLVTNVRTTVVGTPWRDLVFVELETDNGLVGVGEVRPLNKTDSFVAVVDELAGRYVVGADPFDVERLAWAVERLEYGRPSEHGQSALAAFDIASWDLIGQHLGVPVWKLLGGRFRDRVPAYANGWYQAEYEPARIAELAVGVVARGYRAMKLDPFSAASVRLSAAELRAAIAVVEAVRDAVGPDIDLMIEMHGRFSPDAAAQVAVALEPFAPRWIEEPVPPENAAALARVRRATNTSIATGERIHTIWDAAAFIEGGDVDIIQADLTHFGGFTGMRRLAGWTEAHYLTLAPHNVGGPVATAANVHFAVATRNVDIVEHFNDFADAWVSELVDAAPSVDPVDGCFALPERPGLGLRLDHDACARHPRSGARLQLFVEGWQKRDSTAGDSIGES